MSDFIYKQNKPFTLYVWFVDYSYQGKKGRLAVEAPSFELASDAANTRLIESGKIGATLAPNRLDRQLGAHIRDSISKVFRDIQREIVAEQSAAKPQTTE